MKTVKKITTESEYRTVMAAIEILTEKGTQLGDMELLNETDKAEYMRLAELAHDWESIHYPLPIVANPLIEKVEERMATLHLRQRDTARLLGISEARLSEFLHGKRGLNIGMAKRLRDKLNISSDLILDNA